MNIYAVRSDDLRIEKTARGICVKRSDDIMTFRFIKTERVEDLTLQDCAQLVAYVRELQFSESYASLQLQTILNLYRAAASHASLDDFIRDEPELADYVIDQIIDGDCGPAAIVVDGPAAFF